jgi:hypothetical protein
MVTPCLKYLSTRGKASTMGPVTTTVSAILRVWVGSDMALMTALLTEFVAISFL